MTVAVGATSAASRSRLRLARTSCTIPMLEFTTTIPRKSASSGSPKTKVTTANAMRMALNTVKTFATTILVYDRPLDIECLPSMAGPGLASGASLCMSRLHLS
jgi:hypothetical protein